MAFFSIRVKIWVNFVTHGCVNGAKARPNGFMGMDLVCSVTEPSNLNSSELATT
jgi:hypothetical protein